MEPDLPSSGQLLGRDYLDTQTLEQRRGSGRVYTPPHLVRFVLELAGYDPRSEIERRPILDPACGAGAFLEKAVAFLHERLVSKGVDSAGLGGYCEYLTTIEENLWGVDVDARSCRMARDAVHGKVEELTGRRPPEGFFSQNTVAADFLLDEGVDLLPPILSRQLAFIVGNPPYVSATRIDRRYKDRLRSRFRVAGGRLDLYTVFVERALTLLPVTGRMALITPDKFLTNYSARSLRSYVLQVSAVRAIALFESHKVFEDAAIVPCVTVLERGGAKTPFRLLSCSDRPDRGATGAPKARMIDPAELDSSAWHLRAADVQDLARKLRAGHQTLQQVTLRISAGPATGRDSVFVLSPTERGEIEPELLRPAIRGRDISAYRIADPDLRILLPYTFGSFGAPELVQLKRFPGAARYLEGHREKLSARHCVRVWGKPWFDLHDQPAFDLASQAKILVPDVANSNRFAVDNGVYFPLHSVYYILPRSGLNLHYLVAVLNSSIATFLMRIYSPIVKDGFNRYRQQFLMSLPIPNATSTVALAIARAAEEGDVAEADGLVRRLFPLDSEEESLIDAYISERLEA